MNNYVRWSKNWGGVRKCYEGKPAVAVGGFSIDLDNMPAVGNAMPAGTPVYADEVARTIVPLYTFKVTAVDTTNNKVTVEKFETGTVAKAGMKLIVVGDDLDTAADNVATVSAVDSSNSTTDVLTVSAVTGITVGAVLAESQTSANKVKVVPNGLTYCDNALADDAVAMDVDYIWNCMEKPVLERRMPPLTDSIKKALRDNECYFRFSNRK